MDQIKKRYILVYFSMIMAISLPLFLLPINLFKGEIVRTINSVEVKEKVPMSLSYFIGVGYEKEDLVGIDRFYLLPEGYIFAIILIFGFPFLIVYRLYLRDDKRKQ